MKKNDDDFVTATFVIYVIVIMCFLTYITY
jgi:hypothetical protein